MSAQNFRPEGIAEKAQLRMRDVALVALLIAGIVVGNVAIVRAMDVALDAYVVASR